MARNTDNLAEKMMLAEKTWRELGHRDQTSLFKDIVPIDAVDYTETFDQYGLNKIFTCERLRTGKGFNCLHMYRSTQVEHDIIIFDDGKNLVIQPMGEPGRDVPDNKIGHLMVVSYDKDSPKTISELLPSVPAEYDDLDDRIQTMRKAVQCVKENVQLGHCGPGVVEKAKRDGVPLTMGIQEYFVHQIARMSTETRNGPPGYKVHTNCGCEFGSDGAMVASEIKRVFESEDLESAMFVQGTDKNTQILAHIHNFMRPKGEELPETINENYLDVEMILALKGKDLRDAELTRTATPPVDVGLSRQMSGAPRVGA